MSKGIIAVSLLAVGLLAGLPAQASVIYTSRSSTVSGNCGQQVVGCTSHSQTSTDFSPFSASFSGSDPGNTDSSQYQVSQHSTLEQNQINVSMSAYKQGFDSASSSFDLHFTVDAPTSFMMSGNLGYWRSSGSAQISLTGPSSFGFADVNCGMSGDVSSCTYSNQSGFPPPYSTTTLAPGLYELLVNASNTGPDYMGGPGTSNAKFTMTFTPTVPIPAAAWLFVTGLLGLRRWLPKSSVAATA